MLFVFAHSRILQLWRHEWGGRVRLKQQGGLERICGFVVPDYLVGLLAITLTERNPLLSRLSLCVQQTAVLRLFHISGFPFFFLIGLRERWNPNHSGTHRF